MKFWALHLSFLMVVISGTLCMGRNMNKQIAEQDKKLAEQDKKISEQDEKIAQQDKKIVEQNEKIADQAIKNAEQDEKMAQIVRNVKLIQTRRQTHRPWLKALSGTSTTTPQDSSLLFITGGHNGHSVLSSTETYPRSSDCSPSSLPSGRYGPTTFVITEPTALIATCGGVTRSDWTDSCLVLDPINGRWDESRMGNLTVERSYGAAATLDHIGVFIVGGLGTSNSPRTSEFLAAGQMQWQEGPALPVEMGNPCVVEITPTSFLSIYGTDIREFDAAIAGPTSSEGWREAGRWPALKTSRTRWPGCAKIGQKVIIAGGHSEKTGELSSTEVLDLVNRRIISGGDMATPREFFHIATIISGGEEKLFAFTGSVGLNNFNSVEEWVEESSTWKAADNLVEERFNFGLVRVPRHLVCPL